MPEVSVIIPAYNSARYLRDAVDSVLAQTFKDLEVLVIDDGSTDDTESVMRRYGSPVRYIPQQNGGVSAARNRGIGESLGTYVAFLDADDVWYRDKLERQMAALKKQARCRACCSAFTVVDSELEPIGVTRSQQREPTLEGLLTCGNLVGTPSTVVSERSLFENAGRFDTTLSQCADWDMWIRLAAETDFLYIDRPLAAYRQHPANMSRNPSLLERDSLAVLEKGYARQSLPAGLREHRRAAFARNYMVVAGAYLHARRYRDSARCTARAITMDFKQAGYLMAFPIRIAARLRARSSPETV
jgi:glycosyltransferase involved in cell wall biosynthesis